MHCSCQIGVGVHVVHNHLWLLHFQLLNLLSTACADNTVKVNHLSAMLAELLPLLRYAAIGANFFALVNLTSAFFTKHGFPSKNQNIFYIPQNRQAQKNSYPLCQNRAHTSIPKFTQSFWQNGFCHKPSKLKSKVTKSNHFFLNCLAISQKAFTTSFTPHLSL